MDKVLQVRQILATRGLTLYRVSRKSAEIFGRSSPFHIPHNLYSGLANPSSKLKIYQILALSHITNYRLSDWLAVFGFDLDAIFRLQLAIPRLSTTLLHSTVHDTHAWIPWFTEMSQGELVSSITPLGQLLAKSEPRRAKELLELNKNNFLYARIGKRDFYARPYFVPGSIVRADTRRPEELVFDRQRNPEDRFFLVEGGLGCTCSRLIPLAQDRILLHSPAWPCADRELHLGRDARILGAIDAEIRPVAPHCARRGESAPQYLRKSRLGQSASGPMTLRNLLRCSRIRMGLSFREASAISRFIATTLADKRYFAAAGTLSDYETLSTPPRHIQKILTLCLSYGLDFDASLEAFGVPLDRAGHEQIPDELVCRQVPSGKGTMPTIASVSGQSCGGFLSDLVNRWEEVPLFLRLSLEQITGIKNFSLSDVFWVGGNPSPRDSLLVNATFAVVNRRAKSPGSSRRGSVCEPPLYLILRRDGTYLCARCVLDEDKLVVYGYPQGRIGPQQFRNGVDAEVVGRVVAILRQLR